MSSGRSRGAPRTPRTLRTARRGSVTTRWTPARSSHGGQPPLPRPPASPAPRGPAGTPAPPPAAYSAGGTTGRVRDGRAPGAVGTEGRMVLAESRCPPPCRRGTPCLPATEEDDEGGGPAGCSATARPAAPGTGAHRPPRADPRRPRAPRGAGHFAAGPVSGGPGDRGLGSGLFPGRRTPLAAGAGRGVHDTGRPPGRLHREPRVRGGLFGPDGPRGGGPRGA